MTSGLVWMPVVSIKPVSSWPFTPTNISYSCASYVPPCLRTCFDGHLCMLEQYPLIDKSVHFFIQLERPRIYAFISAVLVSVCFLRVAFQMPFLTWL